MRDCDVVVVGGGPAGSTTAETLAAAGFEVLVFEKSAFPGKSNVCGGMFCMACARDFKIDPSIFEKVVYKGIHSFGFATIGLDNKDGFVMILRDRFDNYLANRAVNRAAKLITCAKVTDIRVLKTGLAEVTFRLEQGSAERVKTRAIVLADGPNSLSQLFLVSDFISRRRTSPSLFRATWRQRPTRWNTSKCAMIETWLIGDTAGSFPRRTCSILASCAVLKNTRRTNRF